MPDLVHNLCRIFSRSFFFTAFLSKNMEIVSTGKDTKTCVNKSFNVTITKYTLLVLLAFTVLRFLSIYLLTPNNFEFLG